MHAKATFHTQHATRHLEALCQHFAKRVVATFTEAAGHVAFPFGACALKADEGGLTLTATARDVGQLDQVIDVVTRHLERFAFRENPVLDWDISSEPHSQESDR
ncbi:MAG: DUF2218 domain-containing protein [Pseudomonadota bacterium]